MSFKRYFHASLLEQFPSEAGDLITSADTRYAVIRDDIAFARRSRNPIDRRLNFAAYFLSFIQALDGAEKDYETIRAISLHVAHAYVKPKNELHAWLKRLPPKLISLPFVPRLLAAFNNKIRTAGHPDGFVATVITDKEQTYGFGYGIDIHECGICKLFAKHNGHKYASILCEVDYITTQLAGLEMFRTGTIANGATKCDFRYRRRK